MKLYTINTGYFKLDGGAMFGVVPKTIWNKLNPADENNLCTWAMRCLLVKDGKRLILIDTGCGYKQGHNFFKYYYLHGEDSLERSLSQHGFSTDDVTDVILTHLHFDHAGGALKYNEDKSKVELTFKNATYWSHKGHWFWASYPNAREGASFLKENFKPIEETGQLRFISKDLDFGNKNFSFMVVNGHTEGMIIPKIKYDGKTIVYLADLIPSVGHIPLAYVMGYDVRPLDSMKEKDAFLKEALENEYILYFEHDPVNECGTVKQTEKGIRIDKTFTLEAFMKAKYA